MMMISARSPKQHSRRRMAKLSMSNSFDLTENSANALISASKAISMPNSQDGQRENDIYDMAHASSESFADEASKISFTNANFEGNMSFGQLNATSTHSHGKNAANHNTASLGRKEKNVSGKIYKKHHSSDSQTFLPKPDTSALIKNIDKKLSGENLVPILIVSKGRKLMKNKVSQSSVKLDELETSQNNHANYADAVDNTGSLLSFKKKKHYASHNVLIDNSAAFEDDITFDTAYDSKGKFQSQSTLVLDESTSRKKSPESAHTKARNLYKKYKEQVNCVSLLRLCCVWAFFGFESRKRNYKRSLVDSEKGLLLIECVNNAFVNVIFFISR